MFISDPHEKQPSLRAVHCHLANELVQHLRVQLLSNGTNPEFPGLSIFQHTVESSLQIDDIFPGSRLMGDVLNEQLVHAVLPIPGGDDRIQYFWIVQDSTLHSGINFSINIVRLRLLVVMAHSLINLDRGFVPDQTEWGFV